MRGPSAARGVLTLLAVGAIAAGCGSSGGDSGTVDSSTVDAATVDSTTVEQGIESSLSTSSVKVTSAKCPSNIPSDPGQTFDCTVTLSNGATGDVVVTQKSKSQFSYAFKSGSFQIPGATVDAELEQQLAKEGYPGATVTCPSNIIVKEGTTVTCDVGGASGLASGSVTFTFTSATGEVGSVQP